MYTLFKLSSYCLEIHMKSACLLVAVLNIRALYGLCTKVSANFWKFFLKNNTVHTTSVSLISMYQLVTLETFTLPDIMKVIAWTKSLIPVTHFLHSMLKNYSSFQHF